MGEKIKYALLLSINKEKSQPFAVVHMIREKPRKNGGASKEEQILLKGCKKRISYHILCII
jgi:hypothetical protein